MKGYINPTNNKTYMLGDKQYFLQSESGRTGYFYQKCDDGLDRIAHTFRIFGKIFIY